MTTPWRYGIGALNYTTALINALAYAGEHKIGNLINVGIWTAAGCTQFWWAWRDDQRA